MDPTEGCEEVRMTPGCLASEAGRIVSMFTERTKKRGFEWMALDDSCIWGHAAFGHATSILVEVAEIHSDLSSTGRRSGGETTWIGESSPWGGWNFKVGHSDINGLLNL